jgi:hypothetical protein
LNVDKIADKIFPDPSESLEEDSDDIARSQAGAQEQERKFKRFREVNQLIKKKGVLVIQDAC